MGNRGCVSRFENGQGDVQGAERLMEGISKGGGTRLDRPFCPLSKRGWQGQDSIEKIGLLRLTVRKAPSAFDLVTTLTTSSESTVVVPSQIFSTIASRRHLIPTYYEPKQAPSQHIISQESSYDRLTCPVRSPPCTPRPREPSYTPAQPHTLSPPRTPSRQASATSTSFPPQA